MLWYFWSHEKCMVVTRYTGFQLRAGIIHRTSCYQLQKSPPKKKTDEKKGGPTAQTPWSKWMEWDLLLEIIPSGSGTNIFHSGKELSFLPVRRKPVTHVKTMIRNQDAKSATQICKQHLLVSAALTRGRMDVKCDSQWYKTFHFEFWEQAAGKITLGNKTVHFLFVLLFIMLKYFSSTSLNVVSAGNVTFFFEHNKVLMFSPKLFSCGRTWNWNNTCQVSICRIGG